MPAEDLRTELPALQLRAEVKPESINPTSRTADLVFSTGAPVKRYDWVRDETYYETLSLEPDAVRLGRLNSGAPFLDAHQADGGVERVLGVVVAGSARVAQGQGLATVRLSKRDAVEPVWQDVRDGILRNVSVGYIVHKYEVTPSTAGAPQVRHAVDWEPFEISAVPVGADAGAHVRDQKSPTHPCILTRAAHTPTAAGATPKPQRERTMPEETTPVSTVPTADMTVEEMEERAAPNEADTAADQERDRITGILSACEAVRLPMSTARKFIDDKVPLLKAQTQVLELLKGRGLETVGPRPGPSRAQFVGADPLQTVRDGIEGALLHRIAPQWFKLDDNARQYRTFSLLRTMEECLEQRGVRTRGMSRSEILERALVVRDISGLHTTSDFPNILADVANKTLRAAYQAAPQTWQPIARQIDAPDFKTMNRMQLGEAPGLLKVNEHGEFKSGTIAEGKEQFALATYGRIFGITRQGLINDDLDAFGRLITAFAQSARNLESDLVYFQLLANQNMGDGNALFATAHGNFTTPGTAISVDSLGVGRAAMRKQTGLDGTTYINLVPRYLIVPPGKETLADQFTTQITPAQGSNVNPFTGRLTVIAEPRLEGGVTIDGVVTPGSPLSWYMAASLDQPIDLIEYAYLAGNNGPDIQTRAGFEIDGVQTRCRHDFAAKPIDWRGFYKNAGA